MKQSFTRVSSLVLFFSFFSFFSVTFFVSKAHAVCNTSTINQCGVCPGANERCQVVVGGAVQCVNSPLCTNITPTVPPTVTPLVTRAPNEACLDEEGYISGRSYCVVEGGQARVTCNASNIFVDSSCGANEVCLGGECRSTITPPPIGDVSSGDACPEGVVQGQYLCDPEQGSFGRLVCTRDNQLMVSNCSVGQTCSNGLCNTTPVGEQPEGPFELCAQAGVNNDECLRCAAGQSPYSAPGIWTGVGCIPYSDPAETVRSLISIGLGISGGVVVLMSLAGAFLLSTSQGEPKRVDEANSLITSAVAGILFIIFSVTILRFIGVNIFRLPAFG